MAEQPTPTGRLASLGIRRARRIVTTPDGVRWTVRRRLFREPTLVTRVIETAGDPGRWTRAGEVGVGSGLAVVEGAGAMQLVVTPLTTLLFPLLVTLEVALHLVGLQLALPVCR